MPYGILTTANTGIPDNVDLAALNVYQTAEGIGYGTALGFAREAARQFGSFNWPGQIEMASIISYLAAPTPDDQIRWRMGDLNAQRVTRDFDGDVQRQHRERAGSQVPDVRGVVPLGAYNWETTRPGRNGLRVTEIESDIVAAQEALANDMWSEVLRAAMYKTGRDVIGSTTGQAVGWVGGTEQDYTPGRNKGTAFTGHNHYLANGTTYADTANGRRALFAAMATTIKEHGRMHSQGAPLLLLHGNASLADVQADAQYATPTVIGVVPGSSTDQVIDVPPWAHGKMKDSGAWCVDVGTVLAQHYYVMVKSYGPLNPRNPIRLFYPPDVGFGPLLVDLRSKFPIDANTPTDPSLLLNLAMWLQYGFAVQDPEAGAAGLIAASGTTWVDPTI